MKWVVYIIALCFFFQSCSTYKLTSLSLSELVGEGKVIIVNQSNQPFRFDSVVIDDSKYFGVYRKDSTFINPKSVKRIKIEDNRYANEYKNKVYATHGYTSYLFSFNESAEYFASINYERQFLKTLNGRIGFGNTMPGAKYEYLKQTFYYGSITYLKGNKNVQFEISAGYSLTKLRGNKYRDGGIMWGGGTYDYVNQYFHYPLLEFGLRVTKGPFLFRLANGWPFTGHFPTGPNLSLGYSF